ncbi:MAG: hypothetical protein JWO89_2132 [Verrucomicrobiaceae bacterium]|nr:hypothetical protein [Verrucomicrobiaceae bacterium]
MNRLLKLLIALLFILLLGLGVHVIFRGMPVLPSSSYKLTATRDGRPITARLLHTPGATGQYYIALGSPSDPMPVLYRWFHVDFLKRRVSIADVPTEPKTGPAYVITNTRGLGLPSPKIEDYWTVDFMSLPGGVRFSGASLSITLSPP